MHLTPAGGTRERRMLSLAIGRRASQQCWGVTARKARHNSSNVRGVTAGQVRHNYSRVNWEHGGKVQTGVAGTCGNEGQCR